MSTEPQPLVFREAPATPALAEMPDLERPQERLEKLGAKALRDSELVAMLLRTGTAGEDVLAVATRLVHDAGSLAGLVTWTPEDFMARRGIGKVKALQLATVMEIARRVVEQGKEAAPLLDNPDRVAAYFHDVTQGVEVEKCWVLCLGSRLRLIRCVEITSGTAQSTLIAPREVFRPVLRHGATAAIVVHNHPSGDPTPSKSDVMATRRLRDAAVTLDITFQDHVILGKPSADRAGTGWFSFRTAGLL